MKCPVCDHQAIGFFDWIKGMKWYKTSCKSCGASLRATNAIIIVFIVVVFLGTVAGLLLVNALSLIAGLVIVGAVVLFASKLFYDYLPCYEAVDKKLS